MARKLLDTGYKVEALGIVGHEDKRVEPWSYRSVPSLALDLCGIRDDRHYGDIRTWRNYDSTSLRDRIMPNERQLSIVSHEDLLQIAHGLDLPVDIIEERTETIIAQFMAEQLAANIVVEGAAQLNDVLSPGALLVFGKDAQTSPIVRVTEYNGPCKYPIRKLAQSMAKLGEPLVDPGRLTRRFIDVVAKDKRGWVGSVLALPSDQRMGTISVGQSVRIHKPLLAPIAT